jgi:hypothetical protein
MRIGSLRNFFFGFWTAIAKSLEEAPRCFFRLPNPAIC